VRHTTRLLWARAARGSPTAMLLARKGYRVLVVDRATFPSDTESSDVEQNCDRESLAPSRPNPEAGCGHRTRRRDREHEKDRPGSHRLKGRMSLWVQPPHDLPFTDGNSSARHVVPAITAPNQKKQLGAMSPAGGRALT
jgi:hypothetical protein